MSAPTRIRLLAIDVDGTLAIERDVISARTRAALHHAHDEGLQLAIATGRRYRTTQRILDSLGLALPFVCLGGALVKRHDHSTLATQSLPGPDAEQLIELAREVGVALVVHHDTQLADPHDFLIDDVPTWSSSVAAYHDLWRQYARTGDAVAEVRRRDDVLILSAFCGEQEARLLADSAHRLFPGRIVATVVPNPSDSHWYCELAHAQVSKWSGLVHLTTDLGIELDQVCAVGDQVNDLSMLRGAAIGVAMGNAPESVRAAADWVTSRHDEDGLVGVVERLLR